jgi:hypothetical protein
MARPSKYTPEVVKRVTDAIKLGATYELAAAYAGIAESTFYDWQAKKPEFSEQVKAAWKLERRYPEMYGRTVQDQRHSDLRTHAEQVAAELGLDADARARLIDYAAEKKQRRAS